MYVTNHFLQCRPREHIPGAAPYPLVDGVIVKLMADEQLVDRVVRVKIAHQVTHPQERVVVRLDEPVVVAPVSLVHMLPPAPDVCMFDMRLPSYQV